mmetsp:Transcript_48733/g.150500  ORF Transcript_48733/g.150500 Transcript_48733/m.150500 type:complete len:538 (-) Transcript_48733:73-1686(-)
MADNKWVVVGGADKGGIVVRVGEDLGSPAKPERLSTGAVIKEVALHGERLYFEKLAGTGPDSGWVSLRLKVKDGAGGTFDKDLVIPAERHAPQESGLPPPEEALPPESQRPTGGFQQKIANGKKVRIRDLKSDDHAKFNGKNGAIMAFDAQNGRYAVKVVILSDRNVGNKAGGDHILMLKEENIELHPDQIERDNVSNGDEIVLLGAGDAKRKLYEVQLDPQYWYDKAIERVFQAKNDFEVLDVPVEYIEEVSVLKKAYRKISLAVHPDKNKHPQAGDAFRKVYGAFETLMDLKQQRRILWILGKLSKTVEEAVTFEEEEEDELFQWWWEASVPEIEKQVAEFEGQQFDEYGAMWISDGLGGDVEDVKWVGLETAKRLHKEDGAFFLDVRDAYDFVAGHIPNAYSTPLPDIIDFGLVNVFLAADENLISHLLANRKKPIVIYSEVATPFSRCRAFCRWLLRAGHCTIKAERLRRLRGGIFGWKHKDGPVARPLQDEMNAMSASHLRSATDSLRSSPTQGDGQGMAMSLLRMGAVTAD